LIIITLIIYLSNQEIYMIEVRWEILEEESRAIKVMVDMAKIPCKLLEKNQKSGYEDS
jgi:hypothetical protein